MCFVLPGNQASCFSMRILSRARDSIWKYFWKKIKVKVGGLGNAFWGQILSPESAQKRTEVRGQLLLTMEMLQFGETKTTECSIDCDSERLRWSFRWGRLWLCISGWLPNYDALLSASWVRGLKMGITTSSVKYRFLKKKIMLHRWLGLRNKGSLDDPTPVSWSSFSLK